MSIRQEIETWVAALAAYDSNDFDEALGHFEHIADTSKILFNCGVINATLGHHARAVVLYQRAVELDRYLAVAYYQQGVSNFLQGDFEEALANFNDTLLRLRGNTHIDYEQLGLRFKLYACEALFNRGLCYIYLQQTAIGMDDLAFAAREKAVPDHDVIDDAIRERADGYTVFSIPVGVVYRPNEAKIKSLPAKNWLGRPRLVAAAAPPDTHPADPPRPPDDDRPPDRLSYAALHLVRPHLHSRTRLLSEPPRHRTVFPPTPPPEPEAGAAAGTSSTTIGARPPSAASAPSAALSPAPAPTPRRRSAEPSPARPKPSRLDLGAAAFDHRAQARRPARSASERPGPRHATTAIGTATTGTVTSTTRPLPHRVRRELPHPHPHPHTISEEDTEDPGPVPLAFEIVPPPLRPRAPAPAAPAGGAAAAGAAGVSAGSRPIRLKLRRGDDTRYVMTTAGTTFAGVARAVGGKFGIGAAAGAAGCAATGFRLKVRDDEGDEITVGDQEDWEVWVAVACGEGGGGNGNGVARLEMWVVDV